jgi:hypothetical protein
MKQCAFYVEVDYAGAVDQGILDSAATWLPTKAHKRKYSCGTSSLKRSSRRSKSSLVVKELKYRRKAMLTFQLEKRLNRYPVQ